jgi:hypothetical protein
VTIAIFTPKANVEASEILKDWIVFARQHHPFGKEFDWDSNEWDLTAHVLRRAPGTRRYRIHFCSSRDTSGSRRTKTDFLREPCLSFSKAVISETHRLTPLTDYTKTLLALRALEDALVETGEMNIASLTPAVFDRAADRLRRLVDPWSIGKKLESIAELLDSKRLCARPIQWHSPFKYKTLGRSDHIVTDDGWRTSKLPDIRSILALAEIHQTSTSRIDRAVTSWVTLALYAPSRCSEILSLPVDCWTELNDGEQTAAVLRWRPAKGGAPMIKMASGENALEVARDAVKFMEDVGHTARTAAQWYFENPGQLYLPPGLEHLRGESLTVREIREILGQPEANPNGLNAKGLFACGKTSDPNRRGKGRWVALFRFEDVQQYVLSLLPPGFPWHDEFTGLYLHESLFVVPMSFFRPGVSPMAHVPQPISISMINHQLGANPNGKTVFSRNQKFAPDGQPWEITSHQFRHFLNTLAQSKYLPQSLIALWSGRADVRQNAWYDHRTPEVHIEAYLNVMNGGEEVPVIGPLNEKISARQKVMVVSAREVLREEIGSLHVTKYGLCRHNYALTPCPKQKDCVGCSENLFVKGDPKNLAEAERMVSILSSAVDNASQALERGESGAKRWLELNEPRLRQWQEVLRIHRDESILEGAICSLPPLAAPQSEVSFVLANRDALSDEENESIDLLRGLDL